MSEDAREAALAHFGVRGMKWGVRKKASTSASGKPVQLSKAESQALAEQKARRIQMGKDVTHAVVLSLGTLAIAAWGGPIAAAGAGAVARTVISSDDLFRVAKRIA